MKKYFMSLVFILIIGLASDLSAQIYGMLKPTTPGIPSDIIPISEKQVTMLLQKNRTPLPLDQSNFQFTDLDTLWHCNTFGYNLGVGPGDTLSSYYEPPGSCYIHAIGIIADSWGNEVIASGYYLMIHKPAHPWFFPPDLWNVDKACYLKEALNYNTMLGEKMWGDLPVPIEEGEYFWSDMSALGATPNSEGDGFVVSVAPFGDGSMGTYVDTYQGSKLDAQLTKYYHEGRHEHAPQWVVRGFSCTWKIVVEFYPTPKLIPMNYGSVLNSNTKMMQCHITAYDPQLPETYGIESATFHYQINNGTTATLDMQLVSGTTEDGYWGIVLPAGYMNPGDNLTYWFRATDKEGRVGKSQKNSFRYFTKRNEVLVFYNADENSYGSWVVSSVYDNLWFHDGAALSYDLWVGLTDGPLTAELIYPYNYLIQLDAYSPATMNDDVIGAWLESGNRCYFWSSQEWASKLCGGKEIENDTTFAPDDWHNKYIGMQYIGGAGHDIAADPFHIKPASKSTISQRLAAFLGDSLQLYLNSSNLGWEDLADAFIKDEGAITCFMDSEMGRTMGIYKQYANSKTVFLTFDPACLTTQPSDYWTEPNSVSIVNDALDWFFSNTSLGQKAIFENQEYNLIQNYPNPFNAETTIRYTITEPARVQVGIYNIRGQQVAELVNEKQSANSYAKIWDAGDCPSGVYFCRIQAGDFSRSIKMILIR
ncbi:MAG: T9SS type A sorting domain-containing protein [Candidatus Zhuqueibacterota bacterium]